MIMSIWTVIPGTGISDFNKIIDRFRTLSDLIGALKRGGNDCEKYRESFCSND